VLIALLNKPHINETDEGSLHSAMPDVRYTKVVNVSFSWNALWNVSVGMYEQWKEIRVIRTAVYKNIMDFHRCMGSGLGCLDMPEIVFETHFTCKHFVI
jgi:hypothetical protein